MIVPEKIILLTSSINEDMRAEALEDYINRNVFGYHIVNIRENEITGYSNKIKDKLEIFGVRHNVNMLAFFENIRRLKVKKGVKTVKNKQKSTGKYKYINNVVNRFNAKALFCLNADTLYNAIRAKEKFGFKAIIVAYFDTFTFDNTMLLGADKYIVENIDLKEELAKRGVDKSNIVIKHFPIISSVFVEETVDECKSMFDIDSKRTIMLNGGMIGDYKVVEIFNLLSEVKDRFNLVVFLGENEKLYQKLTKIKVDKKLDNVKLFTTINNIEKLFKACDLIISIYDVKAIYLAKAYSKQIILFGDSRDVELNDYNYLNKNNKAIYAKDSSDVVVKAFEVTNNELTQEVNVDELKTATAVTTNYLIELLQDLRK